MEHFYQNIDGYSKEEEQGKLLETILKNIDTNNLLKIAEVGVYKGRGTALWNVILLNKNIQYDYYAIDHFLGSSEHDKSFDYYSTTIKNLEPIADKINIIRNDSISESKKYLDEFFDIVYIDASHEYEYVKQDILNWHPKVKRGGIICGDDYIWGWPGVVLAVDEIFGNKINVVGKQQWWLNKQ
jgi:predicted O-methyltransferase YrrM